MVSLERARCSDSVKIAPTSTDPGGQPPETPAAWPSGRPADQQKGQLGKSSRAGPQVAAARAPCRCFSRLMLMFWGLVPQVHVLKVGVQTLRSLRSSSRFEFRWGWGLWWGCVSLSCLFPWGPSLLHPIWRRLGVTTQFLAFSCCCCLFVFVFLEDVVLCVPTDSLCRFGVRRWAQDPLSRRLELGPPLAHGIWT